MGKTYKKIVRNKFEKRRKFINRKKKQKFIEEYENEKDGLEELLQVQRKDRAGEYE